MTPVVLPATFLEFLAQKRPRILSWSQGKCTILELVADRELDSKVGVLRLHGVTASDWNVPHVLSGARLGTVNDLTGPQQQSLDKSGGSKEGQLCILEGSEGQTCYFVVQGIDFLFRPWLDLALTERVRRLNAELGYPAARAIESHLASSAPELLGKEIICWHCLRQFVFEEEYMDCPYCGYLWGMSHSREQLLRFFFHGDNELLNQSLCAVLQAKPGVVEVYRLVVFSWWGHHRLVEVERNAVAAHLKAKAWDSIQKRWCMTALRPLLAREWRRFSQLLDLAPFWELAPLGKGRGFDGADWTLEGMREGHYHFVTRWSPTPESDQENFFFPCECLLELAANETEQRDAQ
jgi:hypothetical protein